MTALNRRCKSASATHTLRCIDLSLEFDDFSNLRQNIVTNGTFSPKIFQNSTVCKATVKKKIPKAGTNNKKNEVYLRPKSAFCFSSDKRPSSASFRPHGGYKGINKHPPDLTSFSKTDEYHAKLRADIDSLFEEETLQRCGSPQWVHEVNQETNHSGESPIFQNKYLSSSRQEQQGFFPEGNDKPLLHVKSSPFSYHRALRAHKYLNSTNADDTNNEKGQPSLGRPTRTTLLRARQRCNSAPVYSERGKAKLKKCAHDPQESKKPQCTSFNLAETLGIQVPEGETLHGYLIGARYNRPNYQDVKKLIEHGAYTSHSNNTPSYGAKQPSTTSHSFNDLNEKTDLKDHSDDESVSTDSLSTLSNLSCEETPPTKPEVGKKPLKRREKDVIPTHRYKYAWNSNTAVGHSDGGSFFVTEKNKKLSEKLFVTGSSFQSQLRPMSERYTKRVLSNNSIGPSIKTQTSASSVCSDNDDSDETVSINDQSAAIYNKQQTEFDEENLTHLSSGNQDNFEKVIYVADKSFNCPSVEENSCRVESLDEMENSSFSVASEKCSSLISLNDGETISQTVESPSSLSANSLKEPRSQAETEKLDELQLDEQQTFRENEDEGFEKEKFEDENILQPSIPRIKITKSAISGPFDIVRSEKKCRSEEFTHIEDTSVKSSALSSKKVRFVDDLVQGDSDKVSCPEKLTEFKFST